MHAAMGIMWIVVAYLQMVPIRNYSLIAHKYFGYFSLLVFVLHMDASINNLVFDEAKHHIVNRIGLGALTFLSSTYMYMSIKAAINHDIQSHTKYAFRAFVYSIEGAGTIRTVAYLQWLFRPYFPEVMTGPMDCQRLFGGQATNCALPYFVRGIFVRLLTLYYIAMFSKSRKKDFKLKEMLIEENIIGGVAMLGFIIFDIVIVKRYFF